MVKIHQVLGLAQVGGAGALFLAWWRSESVQITILLGIGTGILSLIWWTLGRLMKVVGNKIDQWEQNFVTMGETLADVPRMKEHLALEAKVDMLQHGVDRAATRLEDHSGRIQGVEQRETTVVARAFDLVERALKVHEGGI